MLLRENQFEGAAELFFEAAAIPELWPRALQAVADASGAAGGILLPIGATRIAPFPSPGIQEYAADLVSGDWHRVNTRMQRGLALTKAGVKGFITDSRMFTPEELRRDVFYNEFVKPHRMGSTAGIVLATVGHDLVLPFAMERRERDGPFTSHEVRRMNKFAALLPAAAQLALRVGLSGAVSIADGLSNVGKHVALLDRSGQVLHMSAAFEDFVGDAFSLSGGVISSWDMDTARKLSAAIQKACARENVIDRSVGEIRVRRRTGRKPLRAQLVPLTGAAQDVFMLARTALIVSDPEAGRIDADHASLTALGLTNAEARLARRIAAGEDLKHIAREESITVETARTRLKAVFNKTETHRQIELALKLSALLH